MSEEKIKVFVNRLWGKDITGMNQNDRLQTLKTHANHLTSGKEEILVLYSYVV